MEFEQLFSFIPIAIYTRLFLWTAFVLCLVIGTSYFASINNHNLLRVHSQLPAFLFASVVILYIGLRPDDGAQFCDSYYYTHTYYNIAIDSRFSFETEWLFAWLTELSRSLKLSHHIYFLIIALGYVGFLYAACKKLLWENTWMAFLFCISAYSFFSYGVNGIRHGLALHILLYAFALLSTEKKWVIPFVFLLCLGSFGIHRSSILPIVAAFAAYYVVKDPKWALGIWVTSILGSLVAGGFFQNLLSFLFSETDARIAAYSSMSDMSQFSRSGFRWDFLLYSSVPIVLFYYVTIVKKIQDRTFNILAVTYILSNSAWILINRMAFSNRIAYLSWFLYPIILAYALIRLHIWDDQDRKSAIWLMGHGAFTIVMMLLGK